MFGYNSTWARGTADGCAESKAGRAIHELRASLQGTPDLELRRENGRATGLQALELGPALWADWHRSQRVWDWRPLEAPPPLCRRYSLASGVSTNDSWPGACHPSPRCPVQVRRKGGDIELLQRQ